MREVNAPTCSHENDLISYLYGELNEAESRTFQLHMQTCDVCTRELASLQDVRESVVAWRNQCLAGVAMPEAVKVNQIGEKRSALAAIREFFNLSPLWLKGAVAFASLLFCVLAGLAVAHFASSPTTTVAVPQPSPAAPSAEQLNARVQQLVQEELQRRENASKANGTVVVVKNNPQPREKNRPTLAKSNPILSARRPLSKSEREQLAADLRLVAQDVDSEFIDDNVNQ